MDVSGVLLRAAPRELTDRAQAGLRLFELRLTEYAELATEMGVVLPGLGCSPLTSSRTATAKEAAWAARSLRHHLNLGGGAIAEPFHALDEHALIWRLPLGPDLDQAPSGFFYNHPQAGFCIAVNSQMTLGRQVFTLARQLAHAFFHSHSADVVVSMSGGDHGQERFADAFAGEFLVQGDELWAGAHETGALTKHWIAPSTLRSRSMSITSSPRSGAGTTTSTTSAARASAIRRR